MASLLQSGSRRSAVSIAQKAWSLASSPAAVVVPSSTTTSLPRHCFHALATTTTGSPVARCVRQRDDPTQLAVQQQQSRFHGTRAPRRKKRQKLPAAFAGLEEEDAPFLSNEKLVAAIMKQQPRGTTAEDVQVRLNIVASEPPRPAPAVETETKTDDDDKDENEATNKDDDDDDDDDTNEPSSANNSNNNKPSNKVTSQIMPLSAAIETAVDLHVDLIEVALHQKVPVIKAVPLQTVLYKERKKQQQQRSASRLNATPRKEFTLGIKIDAHDLQRKVDRMLDFCDKGHNCVIRMRCPGWMAAKEPLTLLRFWNDQVWPLLEPGTTPLAKPDLNETKTHLMIVVQKKKV